jgi:ribosomal protein S30
MIETKKNEKQTPRIETNEEPKKAPRLRTGIKAGDDWETPMARR